MIYFSDFDQNLNMKMKIMMNDNKDVGCAGDFNGTMQYSILMAITRYDTYYRYNKHPQLYCYFEIE